MTKEDSLILGNIKWLQYCPFRHLDPIWWLMAATVNQSSRADIFLQNTHHGSVLCGLSLDMNHPLESKCPLTLERLLWQQSWDLGLWFWMNRGSGVQLRKWSLPAKTWSQNFFSDACGGLWSPASHAKTAFKYQDTRHITAQSRRLAPTLSPDGLMCRNSLWDQIQCGEVQTYDLSLGVSL